MAAIEKSRSSVLIPENINTTFLTLIVKVDKPSTFAEYKPISLCNLLYKLITKIIVGLMKVVLGECISVEQFGFLPSRQIMDAAGIVRETLHSIKLKNIPVMILKLDLEKAYDKVDRYFLHLILVQIGLPLNIVHWIMSYVNSASFVFLVNRSRGIRRGCPLSPYLFLLIIEGPILLLHKAKANGIIKGVKVSGAIAITHTLFVDDVMIFGKGNFYEWLCIKVITDLIYSTSGMSISPFKSCFRHWNVEDNVLSSIINLFQIQSVILNSSIKYLTFKYLTFF